MSETGDSGHNHGWDKWGETRLFVHESRVAYASRSGKLPRSPNRVQSGRVFPVLRLIQDEEKGVWERKTVELWTIVCFGCYAVGCVGGQ